MNFIKKHKSHLGLLFILLVIFSGSFIYLQFNTKNQESRIKNQGIASHTLAMTDDKNTSTQQHSNIATETSNNTPLTPLTEGNNDTPPTPLVEENSTSAPINLPSKDSKKSEGFNETNNDRGSNTTTENLQLTTYSLSVNDEEYFINLPKYQELTVHELMMILSADSNPAYAKASAGKERPFIFEAKEYPGMGYFVTSINGIENDVQENKYWIYYINGESAKIGISQYVIKKGDVIKWEFKESEL